LLHGNTIHHISSCNSLFVVSNNNKLRGMCKCLKDPGKPIYISFIQGCIYLI